MARPWRLRHKLLLGLALVVAILGTLLAGSVQGLTSYVDSMKTTDSKLSELQRAEELRAAAARLNSPGEFRRAAAARSSSARCNSDSLLSVVFMEST